MSSPTPQQNVIYQLSMYSSLVDSRKGPDLEAALYADIRQAMADDAGHTGNWSVAWGPVVARFNTTSCAINAMYVAESTDTPHTYVLAIAGTNPSSLFDWLVEDGLVSVQLPWPYAVVPGARISLGAGVGLAILQNAAPGSGIPGTGTTLLEFLAGIDKTDRPSLVVTGHSLGGALAPTLALWLHDVRILWDLSGRMSLSTMPTAGPTAGNSAFAAYSNEKLPTARFANAVDVVPHAWQASDLAGVATLYAPSIEPDALVDGLADLLERISARGDYTQLANDTGWFPYSVNAGMIVPGLPAPANFIIQAAWQHTVAYLTYFGVRSTVLDAWALWFQAEVAAIAAVPGALNAAGARQTTAPVGGRPTVIPSGSDPRSAEVAARVLAELRRSATPDQRAVALPIDPLRLVDARAVAEPV